MTTELQDIWDRTIIRAWHKNWTAWKMMHSFRAEAVLLGLWKSQTDDIAEIKTLGLLRVGRSTVYKQNTRRWVADSLAPINDMLWDGKDDDRILKRLKSIDARLICKQQTERHTLRRQTKQLVRVDASPIRRSDKWGTTKAVRSKHG